MKTESGIWGDGYRVFLSHKADIKEEATSFKASLETYGVSAFVAHKDISPTAEWQEEIKKALHTMDAFVALLTDGFHSSEWTDQEIGYALCREVPIIPVKLGVDPYGFIGKVQALSSGWHSVPLDIVKILVRKDPLMVDNYVKAVARCQNFDHANSLATVLDAITSLTDEQAAGLVSAFKTNHELQGSYGFNGRYSSRHGDGLLSHLLRLTTNQVHHNAIREVNL